ncbi:protein-tyrosine phosphatase [Kutzneria viridogrisea]|uniref:Protein-tyrosine phosphatase n=1 Tax=Kutzneria viridogrisea TaxID=47990 RepID=A0ABR6BCI9_9PSEU|nr:tyrosine-protein phosphatase [Kutzneria albida]MBA8924441.1 protein-tyrosine phosphatase [Kutzneria viridogrisea]
MTALILLAVGTTTAQAAPVSCPRTIPFTTASVTQHEGGSFALNWTAPGVRRVSVYTGATQDGIDYSHPVARGEGSAAITVSGLGAADRRWFRLVPDRGEGLTVADRDLHLASVPNLRDAGGYRTADGHWVRMGAVYRSSNLGGATESDLATLTRLGVRVIEDLRTDAELVKTPDRVPRGATVTQQNVLGAGIPGPLPKTPEQSVRYMIDAEAYLVSAPSALVAYRGTLGAMTGTGVLQHCSAGKDRTGWASAVLLTALGVPRATVYQDYLDSNTYLAARNAAILAQAPADQREVIRPQLDSRAEYLDNGFAEADKRYGSFTGYLDQGLHLDTAALRAALLI